MPKDVYTPRELASARAKAMPRGEGGRFVKQQPPVIDDVQADRDAAFLGNTAEPPPLPAEPPPLPAEPPPLPPPVVDPQAARDKAFLQESGAEPPPLPAEPPPLPAEPPPLPPPEEPSDTGGAAGGLMFGPWGVAAGAAAGAGFSMLQREMAAPIGTLEGGTVRGDDRNIADLLQVTKEIARLGTPIKDQIFTKAAGSRM